MTILIAAAAFCVWAYFWVRGALWAMLLAIAVSWGLIAVSGAVEILCGGSLDSVLGIAQRPNAQGLLVIGALAFIPRLIYAKIDRDRDRRMNGLRLTGFNDPRGG